MLEKLQMMNDWVPFPQNKADSTGETGCARIMNISAASSFAIPDAWKGKFLRVTARGCDFQVGTGAQTTLAWDAPSPPGNHDVNAGEELFQNGYVEGIIPLGDTHFNYVPRTTATGSLTFRITQPPNIKPIGTAP